MKITIYFDEDAQDRDLIQALGLRGVDVICAWAADSVGEQMRRLLKLIATKPAEEMTNQLEFLGNWE